MLSSKQDHAYPRKAKAQPYLLLHYLPTQRTHSARHGITLTHFLVEEEVTVAFSPRGTIRYRQRACVASPVDPESSTALYSTNKSSARILFACLIASQVGSGEQRHRNRDTVFGLFRWKFGLGNAWMRPIPSTARQRDVLCVLRGIYVRSFGFLILTLCNLECAEFNRNRMGNVEYSLNTYYMTAKKYIRRYAEDRCWQSIIEVTLSRFYWVLAKI